MKSKTQVLFFFDTEDYTSNRSSDAILDLANLCKEEGVTAQFAMVGLLAQQLRAWNRDDVIDALKDHIIGTHTFGHTFHPDICEQSDYDDYTTAYKHVYKAESSGLGLINMVLQPKEILFACPPGNSKSYVAMYFYANKGIPFYCDTVINNEKNDLCSYCNIEQMRYTDSLERLFLDTDTPADIPTLLDELSAQRSYVIFYAHPNKAVKTEFWDALNYLGKNKHEFGKWEEAPDRDPAETAAYYENIRALIRAVKADERFHITNLNEVRAQLPAAAAVTPDMLPKIQKALLKKFGPVKDPRLSISDIFVSCVAFLRGKTEFTPERTYGFLHQPFALQQPLKVTAEQVKRAAKEIKVNAFLPEKIKVGTNEIGPADFLFAMLAVLAQDAKEVELTPREQLNSIADRPRLEQFHIDSWLHTPAFKDEYLSDRLRLQRWTLK